jgi:hypothetical protein
MKNRTHSGFEMVAAIEAEAATYGVIRTTDARGKGRYHVVCSHCERPTTPFFDPSINSAEEVMAHFKRHGWIFSQRAKPLCSTKCAREARAKKEAEREAERKKEMANPIKPPAVPVEQRPLPIPRSIQPPLPKVIAMPPPTSTAPPPPVIGPNPKIARPVITLLNEHFDTDTRLYHPGWSDERIAKEANAAIAFVIYNREEGGYGKLAEEPETTKMRNEIIALETKVTQTLVDLIAETDAIKVKFEDFIAKGAYHKARG